MTFNVGDKVRITVSKFDKFWGKLNGLIGTIVKVNLPFNKYLVEFGLTRLWFFEGEFELVYEVEGFEV